MFDNVEQKGFTLVELLIVIGIIGILLSIGAPALQDALERASLREATMDIYGGILQARTIAAKNNRNIVLRFDTVNHSYKIFVNDGGTDATDILPNGAAFPNGIPDGAENWIDDPTEEVLLNKSLPNRIEFNSAVFGANPFFRFDNKGLPYDNTGALTSGSVQLIDSKGTTKTIRLLMSGHAQIL